MSKHPVDEPRGAGLIKSKPATPDEEAATLAFFAAYKRRNAAYIERVNRSIAKQKPTRESAP